MLSITWQHVSVESHTGEYAMYIFIYQPLHTGRIWTKIADSISYNDNSYTPTQRDTLYKLILKISLIFYYFLFQRLNLYWCHAETSNVKETNIKNTEWTFPKRKIIDFDTSSPILRFRIFLICAEIFKIGDHLLFCYCIPDKMKSK